MKGPTMRRFAWGSARRTAKWPTSTLRGTSTKSTASAARASPNGGSLPGKKLMSIGSLAKPILLFHVEGLRAGRLAGGVERDLLDAGLGQTQQFLAPALE